jgi:hypothetical protein
MPSHFCPLGTSFDPQGEKGAETTFSSLSFAMRELLLQVSN